MKRILFIFALVVICLTASAQKEGERIPVLEVEYVENGKVVGRDNSPRMYVVFDGLHILAFVKGELAIMMKRTGKRTGDWHEVYLVYNGNVEDQVKTLIHVDKASILIQTGGNSIDNIDAVLLLF